ncbi:flavoprotein [Ancylobacter sp. G4_0304]|uniref:flavoprotein n=1 Tax=Ancylobacter sp. G4_0304 TaxID=3114289 RepID=UPI0039C5F696
MSADETGVKGKYPRWSWALTGSGHFFTESIALIKQLPAVDLFVSKAADEVLRMYKQELPEGTRIFRETTASSAPVGRFYEGLYHTLVVSPASSNTVAKCVFGISDTLVTNCFAQAGKCRVPSIVFACDTAPEMITMAPKGPVSVYPRRIDLENTAKLKEFDDTTVVESIEDLTSAIEARARWLAGEGAPAHG